MAEPALATAGAARGMGRSAIWNVLASAASVASALLVTSAAFRNVPDAVLGVYLTAMAAQLVLSLLDPVIGFAISRAVARADSSGDDGELAAALDLSRRGLAFLSLAALGLGTGGVLLWGALARPQPSLQVALLLLVASLALQVGTAGLPASATGVGDFRSSAVATILGASVGALVALTSVSAWGPAGLAAGQLAAVASGRAWLLHWRSRRAARLARPPVLPSARAGVAVLRGSTALLVLTVAGQALAWTDLVTVGAFAGPSAAAQYRLGVIVPTQAVAILFRAYDVVYPALVRGSRLEQVRMTALLTRVFGALSGVLLGGLIALQDDVLTVLSGSRDHGVSGPVFVLFCLMWAANVPVHGLALLLIARDRQRVFAPLVAVEAALNVVVTVLLTWAYGATGAAVASLLTLAVCNLVLLPLLTRREVDAAVRLALVEGLLPVTTCLAVAVGAVTYVSALAGSTCTRLVVGGATTALLALVSVVVSGGARGRLAMRTSLAAR